MWHASWRREEWFLIQVPALPERSQPVLGVEEPLHIGGFPSEHLLELLHKQKILLMLLHHAQSYRRQCHTCHRQAGAPICLGLHVKLGCCLA